MSLILEALRKLERDRHTQERGFLVLAPPAWTPAGERTWPRAAAIAGMAALAGGAVAALVLWPGRTPPSSVAALGAPAPSTQAPLPAAVPPAATLPPAASIPFAPASTSAPRVAWPRERTPPARPAAAAPAARDTAAPAAEDASATTVPAEAVESAPEEEPAAEPAPAAAAGSPATLRLEAIAERDGQPVAVVNGQVVRVGDTIGTGTVVRIGAAEIEIETDGRRRILRF